MAPSHPFPDWPLSFEVLAPPPLAASFDAASSIYHPLDHPLPPAHRSCERPSSCRSMPSTSTGRYQKKLKQMAGLGMTRDEFDALPVAVRRKYFSTLERLRFAQSENDHQNYNHSSRLDALADHPRPRRRLRKGTLADRRGLDPPLLELRTASRTGRCSVRQNSVSSIDASWFMNLPEKIRLRQFTQEEQDILGGRLHKHCILDATDEAIYKAARGASRQLTRTPQSSASDDDEDEDPVTPSFARANPNFDYRRGRPGKPMVDTVYESFRWMDEEEDLDLKLVLDDYHANLDGAVIPSEDSTWKPSFRRQLSISKMPFNKRSPSLHSRPPTSPKLETGHARHRSRALSLIAPRHMPKASVSSIDPGATHYQDPEARLKLRAYLASPQKFDEAIEFGFPSIDGMAEDKENCPPRLSADILGRKSQSTEKTRSFFWKDVETSSLFDDDSSGEDPESPLTPMFADSLFRPHQRMSVSAKGGKSFADFSHLGINKPMLVKQPEPYTSHGLSGTREMTLRMTLTRPDLRADDTMLYGWQSSKSPLREEALTLEEPEEKAEKAEVKPEVRGPFGGADGWGAEEKENGVVKRIWNRVRSSQRKVI